MKLLNLALAEKRLTGEKEKSTYPKKKDLVVGKWWCRDHSCFPVSLTVYDVTFSLCYAWRVVKAMEIPVIFQAVLTRVESQELSQPLTGKVGVPGVRIELTTGGFSVPSL